MDWNKLFSNKLDYYKKIPIVIKLIIVKNRTKKIRIIAKNFRDRKSNKLQKSFLENFVCSIKI